ncbi:MAG: PqqD family protein [Myxococcota bacterium]
MPRPSRDAAWQVVGGELIVLDARGSKLRGLNATGGRVWSLMDGRLRVAEIARAIAAATRAPEDVVLLDVIQFLSRLHALGLVEVGPLPEEP